MRQETQHWDNIRIGVELVIAGVGQTGLSPTVRIRRTSDGQWWSGAAWGGTATDVAMVETDVTDLPGFYSYAIPSGGLVYADGAEGYLSVVKETTLSLMEHVVTDQLLQSSWDDLRTDHVTAGSFGTGVVVYALSALAKGECATAVWNEPLAGHVTVGFAGQFLNDTAALPDAGTIADTVWDEVAGDHTAGGSMGELANNATPALIADQVWDEAAGDHVAGGSMGELQATAASGLTASAIADAVWDEVASDHTTALSMGLIANVSAGLTQYNHRLKSPAYDAEGRLLTATLSLYHTSAAADADAGAFSNITLAMTYDGDGNLATILAKD
tara:strand:+ start:399 stop:1385 length:987 start_codon:yes stop_codon:yes gene_type:complete